MRTKLEVAIARKKGEYEGFKNYWMDVAVGETTPEGKLEVMDQLYSEEGRALLAELRELRRQLAELKNAE